jgi:uncharacterized protein (DUF697 family)
MTITKTQQKRCHVIIHGAAVLASGVGFAGAQLPTADNTILIPIQICMIMALGAIFDKRINESTAKSALATAAATIVGRGISEWLVGWIPLLGNIVNATTAAAVTEGIGWVIVNDFAKPREN